MFYIRPSYRSARRGFSVSAYAVWSGCECLRLGGGWGFFLCGVDCEGEGPEPVALCAPTLFSSSQLLSGFKIIREDGQLTRASS